MILGVNIRNFDVFDDDTIGLMIEDSAQYAGKSLSENGIRLRNLNALIGRNNTGKSAFIRALSFVKRCILSDVGKASTTDNRPGFMNLLMDTEKPAEFRIFFKIQDEETSDSDYLQYELKIGASETGSPVIIDEKVIASEKNEDGKIEIREIMENSEDARMVSDERVTALSLLGRLNGSDTPIRQIFDEIYGWFFCAFSAEESSDYFSTGNAPGAHKHLNSEGSNVGNVLDYIKSLGDDIYDRLIDDINSKIPTLHKKKKNIPQNLQGSPEKLFKYLLLLRDPDPKTTIFIEITIKPVPMQKTADLAYQATAVDRECETGSRRHTRDVGRVESLKLQFAVNQSIDKICVQLHTLLIALVKVAPTTILQAIDEVAASHALNLLAIAVE